MGCVVGKPRRGPASSRDLPVDAPEDQRQHPSGGHKDKVSKSHSFPSKRSQASSVVTRTESTVDAAGASQVVVSAAEAESAAAAEDGEGDGEKKAAAAAEAELAAAAEDREGDGEKKAAAAAASGGNPTRRHQKVGAVDKRSGRRRGQPDPRRSNLPKGASGEQVAAGWPSWLSEFAGEAINGLVPRRADTFEKIDKIGQGTYSNVYKARDALSGQIVALKKVRFDNLEPESVKFMAREINILRRLNHPNVITLQGLATSRLSCSLYLIFQYMEHDLAGLAANPDIHFTEAQVKCYIHQLLSGLEHCHKHHVLHRDIKGSNLLIDNDGVLKIGDFGLATFFNPDHKQPMTSRVVTLWYRPPELLLGATDYGVGVDLWSAGCILAELLFRKPIMPGRTEVEQLHKIFKLCGSPSDEYWKKYKLPHATIFKPQKPYKRCIAETFKDFPPSSLPLIETLLDIDPADRHTATDALNSEFFSTPPYACEPSSLPKYPPSKEMDAKLRDEEARRLREAGRANGEGTKKTRHRDRNPKAMPAPEANAEIQANIDRRRFTTYNAKSKSEKFPPPHQDGALGYPIGASQHIEPPFDPPDPSSFSTTMYPQKKGAPVSTWSGPLVDPSAGPSRRKKQSAAQSSRSHGVDASKDKTSLRIK